MSVVCCLFISGHVFQRYTKHIEGSAIKPLVIDLVDLLASTLLAILTNGSCHDHQFTFHISLPSLKFTIIIHLPQEILVSLYCFDLLIFISLSFVG